MKDIYGLKLNKRLKSTVILRFISSATTKGMSHHVKGCLIDSAPDKIVLHHGTNDLSTMSPQGDIANSIITLATSTKTYTCKVFVSGITKGSGKWDGKGRKVSSLLKVPCESADIPYIDNSSITKTMLNYSNLHLNTTGTTIFVNNICKALCD